MIGLQFVYKREALLVSTLPFLPSMVDPRRFAEDAWNDARWSGAITNFHTYVICHISAPWKHWKHIHFHLERENLEF